jgi:hypothetical protein
MAIVGAFGLDHLKPIERPMPEPRHNEVVIRIGAVSLNYRDMDMVLGTYPFKFPLPPVPTSDGVGEVVAVGEGVTRAKVGDRVLGTFHQSWIAGRYEEDTPQPWPPSRRRKSAQWLASRAACGSTPPRSLLPPIACAPDKPWMDWSPELR